MVDHLYFDLSLSEDGKSFDIILIKKDKFKGINIGLAEIKENPLLEKEEELEEEKKVEKEKVKEKKVEEKEEEVEEEKLEEEEDESIIIMYNDMRYVTFPGIDSLYTEKELIYVGKINNMYDEVEFSSFGEDINLLE
jgi:hypothetical protein